MSVPRRCRGAGAAGLAAVAGLVAVVGLVGALAGCRDLRECTLPDPARLASLPAALSQTGLGGRGEGEGEGVLAYAPRFELWTDGAVKRRWIWLPPGARIDASDPDAWQFPAGARLWKELTRDGVRVETRMLERAPGGSWLAVAYVWDGDDAYPAPAGVSDALGTPHDVPAADQCMGCHGGTRAGVLGFSAIQLPAETLAALAARGAIDPPPPARALELPGTALERAALGYLHANCGHCHHARRPPPGEARCYDPERDFDLSLRTGELATVDATPVYRTALGDLVRPGRPDESRLLDRLRSGRMPPLGHELVDPDGAALLARWIEALAPR